jgi:hypothetical protein
LSAEGVPGNGHPNNYIYGHSNNYIYGHPNNYICGNPNNYIYEIFPTQAEVPNFVSQQKTQGTSSWQQ